MTKFVAVSVPHNGHHFLRNRILPSYENNTPFDDIRSLHQNTIVTGHFHIRELKLWLNWIEKYRAIVMLRHPARSLLSYNKRNKHYDTWLLQWSTMIYLDGTYIDPLYVCIDNVNVRDEQVLAVRDAAGVKDREIDWSVTNDTGSKYGLHDAEITDELLDQIPTRFIDYYYSKTGLSKRQKCA